MCESATELLLRAAREVGWTVPSVSTVKEFEDASLALLDHVKGGQDHGHARNGVASAIRAAEAGNYEFVRGGLWEAKKVLQLVHYDANPARME
jgi:hypothetical protein